MSTLEPEPSASTTSPPSSPPVDRRRLGVWLFLALISGGICCWAVANTRQQRYLGYYQALSVPITTPVGGQIQKWQTQPGDVVDAGVPLLTLSLTQQQGELARQQAEVSQLQSTLSHARRELADEMSRQRHVLEEALFQAKLQSAGYLRQEFSDRIIHLSAQQRSRIPVPEQAKGVLASNSLPLTPLLQSGLLSTEETQVSPFEPLLYREAARNAVAAARTQVKLCDERLQTLQRDLGQLESRLAAQFDIAGREAQLAAAQQALQEFETQHPATQAVVSTAHGTVGVLHHQPGTQVQAHEQIATLFDEDQPYVLLPVPAQALADLPMGTEVAVVFPGKITRHGIVQAVPPLAVNIPQANNPLPPNPGTVQLRIRPTGQVWPRIPFGAEVEVLRWRFGR